jgi:hypothetical protein
MSRTAVSAKKVRPFATLTAEYLVAPTGKVTVELTSNAKKATVKWRTNKSRNKTKTVKFSAGSRTLVLPVGTTLIRARALATSALSRSAWVFATPKDVTPPGPVSGLAASAVTAASLTLTWVNPADADLAAIIVRRNAGTAAPATPTEGTGITLSPPTATSVGDTGLASRTSYAYSVFTQDAKGNVNPTPTSVVATTLPGSIAESVLGAGVTKVSDTTAGDARSVGYVAGFVPGQSAWLLSTGDINEAVGEPSFFASTDLAQPGNPVLEAMLGGATLTYDAVSFKTTVIPGGPNLHVKYVFASEEYPEYVDSRYNDVMAVLVNGANCATVGTPPMPVAVNSVNAETNSAFFVDNQSGAAGYHTSMDGLTVPLSCTVAVTPGVPVTVEIALADTSDHSWDSAVALLDGGIWAD